MNNRILGIAGSALLIIGIFLPIVSVMGLISFSYFDIIRLSPAGGITGLGILVLGILGLLFALKNMFRLLLIPGVLALGILALDFFRMKSQLGNTGGEDVELANQMASSVGIGWGFFVLVIGAIVLIVAGVMKSAVPVAGPGYGAPPPPPYPPR